MAPTGQGHLDPGFGPQPFRFTNWMFLVDPRDSRTPLGNWLMFAWIAWAEVQIRLPVYLGMLGRCCPFPKVRTSMSIVRPSPPTDMGKSGQEVAWWVRRVQKAEGGRWAWGGLESVCSDGPAGCTPTGGLPVPSAHHSPSSVSSPQTRQDSGAFAPAGVWMAWPRRSLLALLCPWRGPPSVEHAATGTLLPAVPQACFPSSQQWFQRAQSGGGSMDVPRPPGRL